MQEEMRGHLGRKFTEELPEDVFESKGEHPHFLEYKRFK